MEKIKEVSRTKTIYKLSVGEFRKGAWAKSIQIQENTELIYRPGFLTVQTMKD